MLRRQSPSSPQQFFEKYMQLALLDPEEPKDKQRRLDQLEYMRADLAERDWDEQRHVLILFASEFKARMRVDAARQQDDDDDLGWAPHWFTSIDQLLEGILRSDLDLDEEALALCVSTSETLMALYYFHGDFGTSVIDRVERTICSSPGDGLRHAIEGLYHQFTRHGAYAQYDKLIARLRVILAEDGVVPIDAGEPWADTLIADIDTMPQAPKANWIALLNHCATCQHGRPKPKWRKAAVPLLEDVGREAFLVGLARWAALTHKNRTDLPANATEYAYSVYSRHNTLVLKGLCWIAAETPDERMAVALGEIARAAYRTIPGAGPRSQLVGNAAIYSLMAGQGHDGMAQLANLRLQFKKGIPHKNITDRLHEAAEREGVTLDEVEEFSVPLCGLQSVGLHAQPMGDYIAEIVVGEANTPGAARLQWVNPKGKRIKSTPAPVREGYSEEIKSLKAELKRLRAVLPAQRFRLDRMFLERRSWPLALWRERYIDHPVIGTLARRIIWMFTDGEARVAGCWRPRTAPEPKTPPYGGEGAIVDVQDEPLKLDPKRTTVSIWHPVEETPEAGTSVVRDDVTAWRDFLEERRIVQPFKQAHREVYLLTDAERETDRYSNRFAAHFLRQHQFSALCRERGWKNKLRLPVDDEAPPAHRLLNNWDLRAEFWIRSVPPPEDHPMYDGPSAFTHISTDQVRFYAIDAPMNSSHVWGSEYIQRGPRDAHQEPLRLEDIPPRVFSEIMRDVDLFVGVSSVGADANWMDGALTGDVREYAEGYDAAPLAAAAAARLELLSSLVPKLEIAAACSFENRNLIVTGKRATYAIHAGSGSVMMLPEKRYVCIVIGRGSRSSTAPFLPFEGDAKLAEILSKAFLLAEDDKIKDPSILSQMGVEISS